jgi:mRNA interferase RelE/StbE
LPYPIDFRPSALKAYKNLPRPDRKRVERAIDALAAQPRPAGAKKLAAEPDLWRIRVGSFRVIYKIEDDKLLILVVKIGHRKDIYR